jgi:hypothetical protein
LTRRSAFLPSCASEPVRSSCNSSSVMSEFSQHTRAAKDQVSLCQAPWARISGTLQLRSTWLLDGGGNGTYFPDWVRMSTDVDCLSLGVWLRNSRQNWANPCSISQGQWQLKPSRQNENSKRDKSKNIKSQCDSIH